MTTLNNTLWMGNIENWMNHTFLYNLLKSVNIYPNSITIKNSHNKRGCAFLDFYSPEIAKNVLTEHNNKIINGIQLKFNWVHSLEQKYKCSKIKKFTLFIGNIDKSISFDEVKNYFYSKYNSIISAKLIIDQKTGRSKGYAFLEFSNYKEFRDALKPKEPIIFGKQTLVFNSAKNKYDFNEDDKINKVSLLNNEDSTSFKSLDSLNFNHTLSTTETRVSLKTNSIDSINLKNNSNNNNDKNNDNNFDELETQIEYSLKKLSQKYYQHDNKSSLFNYYCSPFIYNIYNKQNLLNVYKNEKEIESSESLLYRNCSFDIYKDK